MADRYWVGGTSTWDATVGTKWSATSGGAGGASVPTASDNVFFNAASGAAVVTISTTVNCLSLNCTGFTGTIAGASQLNVYGGIIRSSGMTWNHTGNVSLLATSGSWSIQNSGKVFNGSMTVGASSSTAIWTLSDVLSVNSTFTLNSGTFNSANYAISFGSLFSTNTNTRAMNLGSSSVTIAGTVDFTTSTGFTFNAGTSIITVTAATTTFAGGGNTFSTVIFNNTTASTYTISGKNTYFDLDLRGPASTGIRTYLFSDPQTINRYLTTVNNTTSVRRVQIRSTTYGIAQTISVNGDGFQSIYINNADFRDIYIVGSAAPLNAFPVSSLGNLGGCRGITFATPKTVYWNQAAGGSWSGTNWTDSVGGNVGIQHFPLPQDTAIITNTGLNTSATITVDTAINYLPTVDMSTRTNAMTLSIGSASPIVYGNWKNGSGTTITGTGNITFSGRNTQTITSAGKSFPNGVTVDSYDGKVELIDNISSSGVLSELNLLNGTFDTKNFAVSFYQLKSENSNVRTLNLGSSTITLTRLSFNPVTNLSVNPGTSQINMLSGANVNANNVQLNNLTFTDTSALAVYFDSQIRLNNLTVVAPTFGTKICSFFTDATITGTLTCQSSSPTSRVFLKSYTNGAKRSLTVGTLLANNADFRDIGILGGALNTAPTGAGNCGGNSGITFPSPKTVYWNLAGTQVWSATAWASSSGGTPNINNFPLAQDTAVFDNTGSAGTVTIDNTWNIGTFDSSARTTAMTLSSSLTSFIVYGDWKYGAAVVPINSTTNIYFSGRGVQNIRSAGVVFACNITIAGTTTSTVQLSDAIAFTTAKGMYILSGTFNAVTYNVTAGFVQADAFIFANTSTLKLGSGTWTLTGTGTVWGFSSTPTYFHKGTANIVLSDTTTLTRTFAGGGLCYNKLTIGGSTGISTTNISGSNEFTELASTKTVAHTIGLSTTTQTFGKWTVTGTVGNVVTVTGTDTNHVIAGPRVSGVDYLAMGTIGFSTTSLGEFYAGANSTGTNATIIKTAAPAPVTRYWVGGTGTWDAATTTKWSATSGGAGGASVPTSADAVIFNSASSATAYTVTCTATQLRCASLTIAGPASGNITWAGTAPIAVHGNLTLPASGITRTYTGNIILSGDTTNTFTTSNLVLASSIRVDGINANWILLGNLNIGSSTTLTLARGTFSLGTYNFTANQIVANTQSKCQLNLGSGFITLSGSTPISFGTTPTPNRTINAGTSTIDCNSSFPTFTGNGETFYNVRFVNTGTSDITINGKNTFNQLTVFGRTLAGLINLYFAADQTIGSLSLTTGTINPICRIFAQSTTTGTPRVLTCDSVAAIDVDFCDISISGNASFNGGAPIIGVRLGDCKGNSGITFNAPKTVYLNQTTGTSWSSANWSDSIGGTVSSTFFPLAQDTVVFPSSSPSSGQTMSFNVTYNIGTIDMSARTTNTMTFSCISNMTLYGNWINGTGTTLAGSGLITFAGRNSQTITTAGKTFSPIFSINSLGGSVTLLDALAISTGAFSAIQLIRGTFNANNYNVTLNSNGTTVSISGSLPRTLAMGSGTWTISSGSTVWSAATSTNLTVTASGKLSLSASIAKIFEGGNVSYSGLTLDQAGAGRLTILGNNTFANITNSYGTTGVATIAFDTTTQTLSNFTAKGTAGKLLKIAGTSSSSPATLIINSASKPNLDYLNIVGVRAYNLTDTWFAGANSVNNGSLGFYFNTSPFAPTSSVYYSSVNITSIYYGATPVSEIYYGSTKVF